MQHAAGLLSHENDQDLDNGSLPQDRQVGLSSDGGQQNGEAGVDSDVGDENRV